MVSYSIAYRHGIDAFCAAMRDAGFDGLILPDLPPPEASAVCNRVRASGLDTILLVASALDSDGFVTQLDAGLIGRAVVVLGGGRDKVDDEIDPSVGIMIAATVGDAVRAGDPVLRVQYRSEERLEDALPLLLDATRVGETPPTPTPLVIDEVM